MKEIRRTYAFAGAMSRWAMTTTMTLFCFHMIKACPNRCICRASNFVDEVTCQGADLTEIPSDLPSSVVRLDLSNNSLTMLDLSQLSFLRRPAEVDLRGNRIHTIVSSRLSSTPIQIQTLILSQNKLVGVQEMDPLADTIVQLDLSSNLLSSVENSFVGMRHLSRLDLRQNQLTKISSTAFKDLVSLRYLRLEDNLIESISEHAFLSLENLSYLVLKGNPIGTSSGHLEFRFNSGFLSYLDLSECRLHQVPRGLPSSIRYLQLRKNRLTVLTKEDFANLHQLGILILDDNLIDSVEDGTFENLPHLGQMWMSNNRLKQVPLRLPINVQRFLLDSNRITELTGVSFANLSQIRTLSLMGNSIFHIGVETFWSLPQLNSLDLSANNITRLLSGTFIKSANLQTLHLSKNPLQSFEQDCFYGLDDLDQLSASYIPSSSFSSPSSTEDFSLKAFADLQKLSRLDLDGSVDIIRGLVASGPWLRQTLSGIRDLNIMKSDLTTLPQNFFSFFPELVSLRISSDRWHCDKSLLWLRDWLLNSSISADDNKCSSPDQVIGRPLTSLAGWEFSDVLPNVRPDEEKGHLEAVTTALHRGIPHKDVSSLRKEITRSNLGILRSPAVTTSWKYSTANEKGEGRKTKKPKARTEHAQPPEGEEENLSQNSHLRKFPSVPTATYVKEAPLVPVIPITSRPTSHISTQDPELAVLEESKIFTTAASFAKNPEVGRKSSSITSSYSVNARNNDPIQFFPVNKTGYYDLQIHPVSDVAASNSTAEHGSDDIAKPADKDLTSDLIIAVGTVAGTAVTALIMIVAIVHLCRKEKAKTTISHTNIPTNTSPIGQEDPEIVYCTPDAGKGGRTMTGSLREDSTIGKYRSSGCGISSTRELNWLGGTGNGQTMPTGGRGSLYREKGSEYKGLVGHCSDIRLPETQMRVYKWEEL